MTNQPPESSEEVEERRMMEAIDKITEAIYPWIIAREPSRVDVFKRELRAAIEDEFPSPSPDGCGDGEETP